MNIFKKDNKKSKDVDDIQFNDTNRIQEDDTKTKKKPSNVNTRVDYNNLKIEKVETNKDKVFQRYLMEKNVIPRHPGVSVFVGSIASGKTTLLHNLLQKPQFYGPSPEGQKDGKIKPYFDVIFLLTGSDDDMYDDLIKTKIIKEQHVKFDPTAEDIKRILDVQQKTIKEKGLSKAPKVLIILEDIMDNVKLMNSSAFRTLFIKPRQNNLSVFVMSQYINLIPKSLRQQAINLMIFPQNRAGNDIIVDQFTPGNMNKKEFMKLIEQATEQRDGETHPFLHINRRVKVSERFRRNLNKIINLNI